jgi:hypothetical protein
MMNTIEKNGKAGVLITSNGSKLLERDSQVVAAISLTSKIMDHTSTAADESQALSSSSTAQQKFDTLSKPASESLVIELEDLHTTTQNKDLSPSSMTALVPLAKNKLNRLLPSKGLDVQLQHNPSEIEQETIKRRLVRKFVKESDLLLSHVKSSEKSRPDDILEEDEPASRSEDCLSIPLEPTASTTEANGDCSVQAADIAFLRAPAQQMKATPPTPTTAADLNEDFSSSPTSPSSNASNLANGDALIESADQDSNENSLPSAGQNKKRRSLSDDEDETSTDSSKSSSLDVYVSSGRRDRSDAGKKPRFREDIIKQRRLSHGSWKTEELGLFLLGLQMYGKDWVQVAALVKTRSYIQVRSHAQYYFAKIEAKKALSRNHGEDSDADKLQFTAEEEKQFMDAIHIHGDDYLMIPKIAPLIPSRTNADVREYLRLYRLAQKRRLKEEIRKQQMLEDPREESSDKEEPTLSRESPKYTVVSPPYTAPYTVLQASPTGAYATSTDILAAQALGIKSQSESLHQTGSEGSRFVNVDEDARRHYYSQQAAAVKADEDARRLHYSHQEAAARNAATLRINSSGGALPVGYYCAYVPAPGAAPVRVATKQLPSSTSTAASLGISNGIPAAAAAARRSSRASSSPSADNLASPMDLEYKRGFQQQHHHNLRQNDRLASNWHDDEPMDNHNDNHNCAFDVDAGAETEVEKGDSSSDSSSDDDDDDDDDDAHPSSAKERDLDSSSDGDEEDSLPPFLERVPNIPCNKTYIHELLGIGTWKSEIINGVTILSPLSL